MKLKLSVLILLASFFLFKANGAEVNKDQARTVALNFIKEKYVVRGMEIPQNLSVTSIESIYNEEYNRELLYMVNVFPNGFAMVSGDDRMSPVLGYSLQHNASLENIAPSNRWWIGLYEQEVLKVLKEDVAYEEEYTSQWDRLLVENFEPPMPKRNVIVEPLLTAVWNQDRYYNRMCPMDNEAPSGYDGRVPNGCVALATAMVMYYHRYPDNGVGSHSYNAGQYGVLSANFADSHFDWDAMTDVLTTYNTNVAKLIYYLGVAVEMGYAAEGSGSHTEYAAAAMKNYYKYSSAISTKTKSYGTTNAQWINMLKQNIDARQPMIYSGYGQGAGGHAFNCDGYDDEDFFHFNFGWGGTGNGFFAITGISPAGSDFTSYQQAVVNIKPNVMENNCPEMKTLTASSGTISDGSQSENYENNKDCMWLVAPSNASSIVFSFSMLDTENENDIITVYAGESTDDEVVGVFSGNEIPGSFTVDGPKALVRFQTNATVTKDGFLLSYRAIHTTNYCKATSLIKEESGTIEDGSEDSDYNNNTYCRWYIQPTGAAKIILTFTEFDVSVEDEVLIFDRGTNPPTLVAKYSGTNIPPQVVLNSGKLGVEFVTDNISVAQGFKANWTSGELGISEIDGVYAMAFYPNPATDMLNLQIIGETGDAMVQIMDMTGRVVYNENIFISEEFQKNLDISKLNSGVYFIVLSNNSGRISSKLVKR